MELSGPGKSPNNALTFRYNANNEELEELFSICDDDPPTPLRDISPTIPSENASPKREKTPSILDKYFKSMRTEKPADKIDDVAEQKPGEEKSVKETSASSSPMKDYLSRLKRSTPADSTTEVKEPNETWKIFHDLKYKIVQAVDDMKAKSVDEPKDKSLARDNSVSDSEENSIIKDSDQQSVGDTDNQVSSLASSIQNLSEATHPVTAKATDLETSLPLENKNSESSDDTHKNFGDNESIDGTKDAQCDSLMDVESGIEALEDTIDAFGDISKANIEIPIVNPVDRCVYPVTPLLNPNIVTNCGIPPSKSNLKKPGRVVVKEYFFNFTMYFLTFFLILNYALFPKSNTWNGFLIGLWCFCFISNFKQWLLDKYFCPWEPSKSFTKAKRSSAMPITYTIPSVKEHTPIKKFEGWINHYRYPDYDPYSYHINKTTTAFMKLEGCNLRISYTKTKIAKRALWDEKIEKVTFYQHRLYSLAGARVILLPKGLVSRRQWSKKYPICVVLNDKEKIQVFERESGSLEKKPDSSPDKKPKELQHENESTETNSPEKRKKFVWRRKEKSASHSDGETGREGLRHRLVRKMHRDKKTDNAATCTDSQDNQFDKHTDTHHGGETILEFTTKSATSTKDDPAEEEMDECDLTKIKEFLEEAEKEADIETTMEGEWSLHVRESTDKHSHLYLFGRTGREKHEWFRRLNSAIDDANGTQSPDTSLAEEKITNSGSADSKESVELAVYKVADKETVAFTKPLPKPSDSPSESITAPITPIPVLPGFTSYEKTFWPYLLKIIQAKNTPPCECRMLPAEVTWVNTVLARIMYDVMRDPLTIARVQDRIQRKLNTMKLPSFMSPLVVTELSLAGSCPLVERVAAPAWDARGVWLDADLRYEGGAYIALLTQINLLKLKEKNVHGSLEEDLLSSSENFAETPRDRDPSFIVTDAFGETLLRKRKPAIYDSDVEDSAESSSDDDTPSVQPVDSHEAVYGGESTTNNNTAVAGAEGGSSKKKFLRMVDKIATNKYFQQVTDYKYVKRAMEGLSNTDIKLHLEIQGLEGRLAFNMPPPPHDRVWIGFRTNPSLVLKARPAVGARTLRFAHISNWIEQKLSKEFEKVMVMPNMEDIVVAAMTPTPVNFE